MSQFNTPTYDIERPTGQCAFTGRTLQPGESYIATLVELDPAQQEQLQQSITPTPGKAAAAGLGLKRLDVALEAWQEGKRPDRLFSHWRTVVAQPNQKKKLFVDDDVLMNLFRRLEGSDQPERLAFRFVLALILMRKRLLRYDSSERRPVGPATPEGQPQEEWWKVTPRGEEQPIEVLNPRLDEEKVQQVAQNLSEILEAEL
jgi:hypothetical protein